MRVKHLGSGVVVLLFLAAGVHHVHYIIDSDGGLCDVCGQDDLSLSVWRTLEHRLLVRYGHTGVHCGGHGENGLSMMGCTLQYIAKDLKG